MTGHADYQVTGESLCPLIARTAAVNLHEKCNSSGPLDTRKHRPRFFSSFLHTTRGNCWLQITSFSSREVTGTSCYLAHNGPDEGLFHSLSVTSCLRLTDIVEIVGVSYRSHFPGVSRSLLKSAVRTKIEFGFAEKRRVSQSREKLLSCVVRGTLSCDILAVSFPTLFACNIARYPPAVSGARLI